MATNSDHAPRSRAELDLAKDGVMRGGGVVPFRMPAGALSYLDRNQYISNMAIIGYFPEIDLQLFGDEYSCLWAKGKRRLIAHKSGFIDVTEPTKATEICQPVLRYAPARVPELCL